MQDLSLLQACALGTRDYGILIHPVVAGAMAIARNTVGGNLLGLWPNCRLRLAFAFSYLGRLTSRSLESLLQISMTTEQDDLGAGQRDSSSAPVQA